MVQRRGKEGVSYNPRVNTFQKRVSNSGFVQQSARAQRQSVVKKNEAHTVK